MIPLATLLALAPLLFSPLAPNSAESAIHDFQGIWDGEIPSSGLTVYHGALLIGTTATGGGPQGHGIVFALSPPAVPGGSWNERILHRFTDTHSMEGLQPFGNVVVDSAGNIYGTTYLGGVCFECGVVFELSPRSE